MATFHTVVGIGTMTTIMAYDGRDPVGADPGAAFDAVLLGRAETAVIAELGRYRVRADPGAALDTVLVFRVL